MANHHPVNAVYDGKINTVSGLILNLINPQANQICLKDMVTAMAHICRFGGQSNRHWSVAEHTLLVWYLAPKHLKRAALLHDATEAYLGDVIKPLKVLLADIYGPIEDNMARVIFDKYRVDFNQLADIKTYDLSALGLEHEYLQINTDATMIPRIFEWIRQELIFSTPYDMLMELFTREFGRYERPE